MASYVSDYTKPGNCKASCGSAFLKNLKPTTGDVSCLISLFFDNLSTILTGCGIFQCEHTSHAPHPLHQPHLPHLPRPPHPLHPVLAARLRYDTLGAVEEHAASNHCADDPWIVSRRCTVVVGGAGADGEIAVAKDLIYTRVIPALGVALFIGNLYYAHQATRMKTQFGRDFTAQPYGINTVGMFPTLFNIMLPVAITTGSVEKAWKVGCTANFVVGLMNIAIGILFSIPWIGNAILKTVPIHALTVPVAGLGITWLGINTIAPCFGTPVAGFIPLFAIFLCYFAKSPITIGSFKVPEVLHWVIPGIIAGYAYSLTPASAENYEFEHKGAGLWIGSAFLEGFDEVGKYFGYVLPVAIGASASGVMAITSAWNAGDPCETHASNTPIGRTLQTFPRTIPDAARTHAAADPTSPLRTDPIGETMISDGLFTIIGAIFGSPFGTVIYFGHPIHKKIGGKTFFSVANGFIYLILCLTGIFPLFLDIIPAVHAPTHTSSALAASHGSHH